MGPTHGIENCICKKARRSIPHGHVVVTPWEHKARNAKNVVVAPNKEHTLSAASASSSIGYNENHVPCAWG